MARKRFSSFLLGLFVTGGFLILAMVLIWVGASKFFEKGKKYVSYFSESVQGLQKDSEVKFRGVKVGRVEDIFIAPDDRKVGVLMLVNLRIDPTQKSVAQLEITGITGVLFVNLVPRESIKDYTPQEINFISEYPVIPSQPSQIKQILAGVEEVIAIFKEIDAKGISQGAQDTFQEMKNFFGGEKTKRIITELEGSSANIKKISAKVNQDMAKGDFSKILGDAKGTFEGTRTLVDKAKKDLGYMMLPETLGKSRVALGQIDALAEKLTRASETLNLLIERLYARPPDILFGQPPQKRWNE